MANSLNFSGVEESKNSTYIEPGTIDRLTVSAAEIMSSTQKGTPGLKITLIDANGASMNHTFWLTAGALPKVQALHMGLNGGAKLQGDLLPEQLIARVVNKSAFFKVTANINEEKGRAYADLPFGGFIAARKEDLKYSNKELEEIERGKRLNETAAVNNADTNDYGGAFDAVQGLPEQSAGF